MKIIVVARNSCYNRGKLEGIHKGSVEYGLKKEVIRTN